MAAANMEAGLRQIRLRIELQCNQINNCLRLWLILIPGQKTKIIKNHCNMSLNNCVLNFTSIIQISLCSNSNYT